MAPSTPRMTFTVQAVLAAFIADPDRPFYGLELGTLTALPSGTIHPILARLEGLGWLRSDWESVDPTDAGRPRRRYYALTPNGRHAAAAALADAQARRRRLATRPLEA